MDETVTFSCRDVVNYDSYYIKYGCKVDDSEYVVYYW